MSHFGKRLDGVDGIVEQLNQSWNDRLDCPPTKILERYSRQQIAIALKLQCQFGGSAFGMCALVTFNDAADLHGEFKQSSGDTQDEFSVLIDNVHIMNDENWRLDRIGGVVRLKSFDQTKNSGVCDSLYFSFISFGTLFIDRPFLEHRELDLPNVLYPVSGSGEVPDNVVKARPQVVDDFASQHTKSWWNQTLLVILKSLQEELVVVLGENWVFAFLKKSGNFRLQIADTLIGPY